MLPRFKLMLSRLQPLIPRLQLTLSRLQPLLLRFQFVLQRLQLIALGFDKESDLEHKNLLSKFGRKQARIFKLFLVLEQISYWLKYLLY